MYVHTYVRAVQSTCRLLYVHRRVRACAREARLGRVGARRTRRHISGVASELPRSEASDRADRPTDGPSQPSSRADGRTDGEEGARLIRASRRVASVSDD